MYMRIHTYTVKHIWNNGAYVYNVYMYLYTCMYMYMHICICIFSSLYACIYLPVTFFFCSCTYPACSGSTA